MTFGKVFSEKYSNQMLAGTGPTHKLRLAVNDDRYEVYGMELEALLQGVILLETQWHRYQMPDYGPDPGNGGLIYFEYAAFTL